MHANSENTVPGELGVWIFVLGDMCIFALFFAVYLFYRTEDLPAFVQSQQTLNQDFGALNTLLLLFSSWFVALAVIDVRERAGACAPPLLLCAIACGVSFAVVKFFEYGEKLNANIGISTNDFYMYYYIFTGIHFIHVVIGLGLLSLMFIASRQGIAPGTPVRMFESGGIFWHMVDLLWIILFPLLYLIR
ncbi:MAG: cytochrome c oxidase subunit 3 [Gammaproteobacteria bacterium]